MTDPHPNWKVRCELARNLKTPPEALAELANDTDSGVRNIVANNPSTPPDVLHHLALESPLTVGYNPSTAPVTLELLASSDWRKYNSWENPVRIAVAGHPNSPEALLVRLSQDKDHAVRTFVSLNPNCPTWLKVAIQTENL